MDTVSTGIVRDEGKQYPVVENQGNRSPYRPRISGEESFFARSPGMMLYQTMGGRVPFLSRVSDP